MPTQQGDNLFWNHIQRMHLNERSRIERQLSFGREGRGIHEKQHNAGNEVSHPLTDHAQSLFLDSLLTGAVPEKRDAPPCAGCRPQSWHRAYGYRDSGTLGMGAEVVVGMPLRYLSTLHTVGVLYALRELPGFALRC